MRTSLGLLSFLLAAAACTTDKTGAADSARMAAGDTMAAAAPADDDAARAAFAKMRSDWQAGSDRKDAAAVAAMYADHAIMVTAESPAANGRAEIEKSLTQGFAASKLESIDSKDVVVSGDLAYDYGTFRQQVTTPDGKTQTVNGHFLVTLRRQADGSWKIVRHLATTPPTA